MDILESYRLDGEITTHVLEAGSNGHLWFSSLNVQSQIWIGVPSLVAPSVRSTHLLVPFNWRVCPMVAIHCWFGLPAPQVQIWSLLPLVCTPFVRSRHC